MKQVLLTVLLVFAPFSLFAGNDENGQQNPRNERVLTIKNLFFHIRVWCAVLPPHWTPLAGPFESQERGRNLEHTLARFAFLFAPDTSADPVIDSQTHEPLFDYDEGGVVQTMAIFWRFLYITQTFPTANSIYNLLAICFSETHLFALDEPARTRDLAHFTRISLDRFNDLEREFLSDLGFYLHVYPLNYQLQRFWLGLRSDMPALVGEEFDEDELIVGHLPIALQAELPRLLWYFTGLPVVHMLNVEEFLSFGRPRRPHHEPLVAPDPDGFARKKKGKKLALEKCGNRK